jgi:hypothetical protein
MPISVALSLVMATVEVEREFEGLKGAFLAGSDQRGCLYPRARLTRIAA